MARKRRLRWALLTGALLFLLAAVAWWVAPCFVEDPLPQLLARRPARVVEDCTGQPIAAFRGEADAWCFPVPLAAISPEAIRATLIAEDANFYRHGGVDYGAVLRALWQNATSFRTVSGASTLSMQVVTLSVGRERSLRGKLMQALRARKMERLHTKKEILEAYLNHAPYGGKYEGIEAAAQAYFGISAAELTFAEATLLCGLPQRPNTFRPDRHPEAARQRQRRLLDMMVRRGCLSAEEADAAFRSAPLRLRDFSRPPFFQRLAQPDENRHAILAGYPIDAHLQAVALQLLRKQGEALPGVNDGACVILRRAAPDPLAPCCYIGTLDFSAPRDGQVDAAAALRSAGSTLKPFFFAEAMDGGLLVPATRLLDAPLRVGDYAPVNYVGDYVGACSARYALASSLNTPVVRLLNELGEARCVACLTRLGLPPARRSGLSLALGTGGASLLALTRAYAQLDRFFTVGTACLVADMLRRPLPRCSLDVAWKTGTANNNTDAWCIGWTPDYTIGVWFGNKSGARAPALVGASAAAPVVGELFTHLYRGQPPPHWEAPIASAPLCRESGLTPTEACRGTFLASVHPTIPLRRCTRCTPGCAPAEPLRILEPHSSIYRGAAVRLPLQANRSGVRWLCDGTPLAPDAREVTLTPGLHTLRTFLGSDSVEVTLQILAP